MLIRTFFAKESKLDRTFFTTDSAIEGLVGLLMFKNDMDATAKELSKEGVKFLVRDYIADQPYGDNVDLVPPTMDNAYIEIVGIDNPHGFYLFAHPLAEEAYKWIVSDGSEDASVDLAPPAEFAGLIAEIQLRVGEIHGAFMIEPAVGVVGLYDGKIAEPAIGLIFNNLAVELRAVEKAVSETDFDQTAPDAEDVPHVSAEPLEIDDGDAEDVPHVKAKGDDDEVA